MHGTLCVINKKNMLKLIIIIAITSLSVASLAAFSVPEGFTEEVEDKNNSAFHMSNKIRRVLAAEMNAIQNGMTNLVIAIPAGHWNDIVETAKKMNEGYIMKKKLSKEEQEQFQYSLPQGYREIDREFHGAAGKMIQAADKHDIELVTVYFYNLSETCIRCHSIYAKKRFPDFK